MKSKTKPKRKQGLTTEEASRVLGVAKNTVITYFDRGTLTGWKNPTTGRRLIDPESVKALAKKSGIELSEEMESWPRRGRPIKTISKPSSRSGPSSR
jgi:Helix-turn-helix domain